MALLVKANESTSTKRYVFFQLCDATDGLTPETGEAGGQPQISSDGAAFTNTGIGTLAHMGNGRYYAALTQAAVLTAGTRIECRYKSANTAEAVGTTVQVVAFDPDDATALGLSAIPTIATDVAGLDGAAMRGTDFAALASVATEARLARLDVAVSTRYSGTPPTSAAIADAVLEEFVTDHSSVANSVAEALKIVRAMVLGKYTLSGTTFSIYAEDGTTVLKQFTVTSTARTPL